MTERNRRLPLADSQPTEWGSHSKTRGPVMPHAGGKQAAGGPDAGAVQAFASSVRGKVIDPSDDGYDSARKVYNAMIDRRPGWIVRCADVADVISCVSFARDHSMPLAIRA